MLVGVGPGAGTELISKELMVDDGGRSELSEGKIILSKRLAQRNHLAKGTDTLGWRWKYRGVERHQSWTEAPRKEVE